MRVLVMIQEKYIRYESWKYGADELKERRRRSPSVHIKPKDGDDVSCVWGFSSLFFPIGASMVIVITYPQFILHRVFLFQMDHNIPGDPVCYKFPDCLTGSFEYRISIRGYGSRRLSAMGIRREGFSCQSFFYSRVSSSSFESASSWDQLLFLSFS